MPRRSPTIVALAILAALPGCRRSDPSAPTKEHAGPAARADGMRVVEAGCATCIYDLPEVNGCKLAVKIDGKAYLVAGSDIDAHGDAHAPDGLCLTARQAKTIGRIEGETFVAESFVLEP